MCINQFLLVVLGCDTVFFCLTVKHNGNITMDQVIDIARTMRPRSMSRYLSGTVKEILGTCQSVGCTIDGSHPHDKIDEVNDGSITIPVRLMWYLVWCELCLYSLFLSFCRRSESAECLLMYIVMNMSSFFEKLLCCVDRLHILVVAWPLLHSVRVPNWVARSECDPTYWWCKGFPATWPFVCWSVEMAEYMLVSAPGEPTPGKTWALINERTSSLSINNKFSIPELKVSQDESRRLCTRSKKSDMKKMMVLTDHLTGVVGCWSATLCAITFFLMGFEWIHACTTHPTPYAMPCQSPFLLAMNSLLCLVFGAVWLTHFSADILLSTMGISIYTPIKAGKMFLEGQNNFLLIYWCFHGAWLHFQRARVWVCSCVQNTG